MSECATCDSPAETPPSGVYDREIERAKSRKVMGRMDCDEAPPDVKPGMYPHVDTEKFRDEPQIARELSERGTSDVLKRAAALINGDRADDYGDAYESFSRTASLWRSILGVPVTPEQVALCMIEVKVSRLCSSPRHQDSWTDIAGYAALGAGL